MEQVKEWLTVPQVEEKTGIPNNTLRRYLRNHGEYIRFRKEQKAYQIAEESIETLVHIRELYQDKNLTVQHVNEKLKNSNITRIITVEEEKQILSIYEHVSKLNERLDKQELKIKEQDEIIEKQNEVLKQWMARSEQLSITLQQVQENQKLLEAGEESKKPFWKRWFN